MTTYYPLEPRDPGRSRASLDPEGILGSTPRYLERMAPLCMGGCDAELHFGFFFDGTSNNKDKDSEGPYPTHSNVARLHDVFDSLSKRENRRIYIAGVGTPFEEEIGDDGRGQRLRAGAGGGWGGEGRINWALLQIHNELHRYVYGVPYTEGDADRALVRRMSRDMRLPVAMMRNTDKDEVELLRDIDNWYGKGVTFVNIADTALAPDDVSRRLILQRRRVELGQKLQPVLASRNPKVKKIRLSVFGFSRGAAEARVFCHWLQEALDAGMTLAGVPVEVNFLGLFDTVTSAGIAQSSLVSNGHGAWGRVRHLVVPSYVQRCVHMVAAHEIRGSFPLDLVLGGNCFEIVYPGVHSDIGGGYAAGEQGRGWLDGAQDDASKLSQIPLCDMYRFAIAEGVPLNLDAPGVTREMRAAFDVSPTLERAFNAYVAATDQLPGARAATQARVQLHYGLYLRWRRLRLQGGAEAFEAQPFMRRARAYKRQDYKDLLLANEELREEWQTLLRDERNGAYSDAFSRRLYGLLAPSLAVRDGIVRAIWGEKMRQWQQVKPYWEDTAPLDPAVTAMLDDYVHDSRAWFKPFASASEPVWLMQQRERMRRLEEQDRRYEEWRRVNQPRIDALRDAARAGRSVYGASIPMPPPGVIGQDRADLDEWIAGGREDSALPIEREGREWGSVWGYLRWRTLFRDGVSVWAPPTLYELAAQAAENARRGITDRVGDMVDDAYDYVGERAGEAARAIGRRVVDGVIDRARDAIPRIPPLR